jgi:L-alanine-DL-glutamate epimerase-like enolase superfamily enzyme
MPEPAPVIERIAASAFRIPTDAPEADGTFNWDHTTLVVAEVSAGGVAGLGYTYAGAQAAHLINDVFAAFLVGADASAIAKAWEQMFASVRNLGSRGICANAISAVDVALWDLKAKSLGRPLVDILGGAGPPSLALRALELRGQEGFLRRLLLYEPGSVAPALGQHANERARPVGCRPHP